MRNHKTRKRGGKAVNAGGYGCIFKPALRCKGMGRPGRGSVSKLMTKTTADKEMKMIERIATRISKIPNYNDYFMVDGIVACQPDKLTKSDLVGFAKTCHNFGNKEVTRKNVNSSLGDLVVLTMPDGGVDLSAFLGSVVLTERLFRLLNSSIVRLITHAVLPMNKAGIYHLDLKSTNIMVTHEDKLKIIDWGISVTSRADIIPALARFPLVFNLPYSSILFNDLFAPYYKDAISKNPDLLKDDPLQMENLRLVVLNYVYLVGRETGEGHFKYISMVVARLYMPLLEQVPERSKRDTIIYNFTLNRIVDYILPILRKYTSGSNFLADDYLRTAFAKNADIWGAAMAYDTVLVSLARKSTRSPLYEAIRGIFVDTVFQNSEKAIQVQSLTRQLLALNRIPIAREHVGARSAAPPKRTRRKRTPTPHPRKESHIGSTGTAWRSPASSASSLPTLYSGEELDNLFSR
jgi:serine/threonine protein kinase